MEGKSAWNVEEGEKEKEEEEETEVAVRKQQGWAAPEHLQYARQTVFHTYLFKVGVKIDILFCFS